MKTILSIAMYIAVIIWMGFSTNWFHSLNGEELSDGFTFSIWCFLGLPIILIVFYRILKPKNVES